MKQSFCVILSFFLLLVASKNANSAEIIESVNFNFEPFPNAGNSLIQLQGHAMVLPNGIVVLTNTTTGGASIGHILYAPPVQLWDTVSGRVANFVTTFTLQTIHIPDYAPADGIVFFIAPQDTQIPPDGVGGALGVASVTSGAGEFVGVEFDTYVNGEYNNPPYSHVGIDVNSVFSSKTVEWNRESGTVVNVTVIYDSSSNTLSVAVRNSRNGEIVAISQVVDLKEKLPPRVKFGFSAASSSGGRQYHVIRSWSFSSSLKIETAAEDVARA